MRLASNRRDLAAAALSLILMAPLGLGAVELAPDAPEVYEVRPGDTLWDIAGRFLRDPWRWPEVWRGSGATGDPDRIYPGDRLRLVTHDGVPRVEYEGAGSAEMGRSGGMRTLRLSPRVRVSALEAPVPTIPIASIAPFLIQPWIAESATIERAPYVVGFPDDRLMAGLHDAVYVRRIDDPNVVDFEILRPGEALRDSETNRLLGYEATLVARARLRRVGDPATLEILSVEREVAVGDRVIPAVLEAPLESFLPVPAPAGMRGRILSVMNGVSQIGQYDVVILNRGRAERVAPGHLFEVHRGGEARRDRVRDGGVNPDWRGPSPLTGDFWLGQDYAVKGWRRDAPDPNAPFPPHLDIRRDRGTFIVPFERAGILMVFRAFDHVSFALVLSAERAMEVGDLVAPPRS